MSTTRSKPLQSASISTSSNPSESTGTPRSTFHLQSTDHTLETIPAGSYLVHATNCFGTWGAGVALAIHDLFPGADEVYAAHCDSFQSSEDAWPTKNGLVGGVCIVPPQKGDHAATVREGPAAVDCQEGAEQVEREEGGIDGIWIGCLFTSYGFGRQTKKHAGLDKKSDIWKQTESALRAFKKLVEKIELGEIKVVNKEGMKVLKIEDNDAKGQMKGIKRKHGDEEDAEAKQEEILDNKKKDPELAEQGEKGKDVEGVKLSRSERCKMDIYSPQFNSGKFGMPWTETQRLVEKVFDGWDGNWYVLTPPS